MNIQPLQNYILLEEIKDDPKNETGIYLPEESNLEATKKAKVLKIGKEVKLPIKEGDVVLFKAYGFDEIVFGIIDKKRYLIGREENLQAILK